MQTTDRRVRATGSGSLSQSNRLAAVQAPVIPIVGRWIAETPGTISLGQGIVSYGPPPEVMQSLGGFGTTLAEHRYGPVEGSAELVGLIEAKLARENGIVVRPDSRVFVTAGAVLLIQGIRKGCLKRAPLTPVEMRDLLRDETLNTSSRNPGTDKIRVMPDLGRILERLEASSSICPAANGGT